LRNEKGVKHELFWRVALIKHSHLTVKVNLMTLAVGDERIMQVEAEIKFDQDHNILQKLVVSVLSVDLGCKRYSVLGCYTIYPK
jgi:hypothetical protein